MTRILRSAWLPPLLVALWAATLVMTQAKVAPVDLVRFTVYLAGWIVLPGTLGWRWLGRNRPARPLGEDLAIGALVGYVLEFPVYFACLAIHAPWLYVAWPLVAAGVLSIPHDRRGLWTRRGPAMPRAWAWSVAAGVGYVVAWFAKVVWSASPVTTASLSRPYLDEPYHLSLATSLKHFFPPQVTYVDGVPLRYHWLSHLHVAAASWASGVEPIVLLRALSMPAAMVLVCTALAFIAVRLTGAHWTGVAVVGALLIAPANFSGWTDGLSGVNLFTERLLARRLIDSPSAAFVNAALILGVLLIVEMLRGTARSREIWVLTALTMYAMVGAKSSSLPTVIAGLVAAAIMAFVLHHRDRRLIAGLAVLSILVFLLADLTFFRGSQQGMSVDPLHLVSNGQVHGVAKALQAVRVLGLLSTAAGVLLLIGSGGWRRMDHVFVVILCASGVGAGLTFGQSGLSEYYFVYVTYAPMLLAAVLGVHAAAQRIEPASVPRLRLTLLVATVVAFVGGLLIVIVDHATTQGSGESDLGWAIASVVVPMLAVLAVVALAAVAGVAAAGRRRTRQMVSLAVVLAFAGLGLAPTATSAYDEVRGTTTAPARNVAGPAPIGSDGIVAARWLRDHTSTSDLIATNAHCFSPGISDCAEMNFWMAGYSERRFLVSGWAYVIWGILGIKDPPADAGMPTGPYWDPALLTENDAAFTHPSSTTIRRLSSRGVTWLFVDHRYPVRLHRLGTIAHVAFSQGDYTILKVPPRV